MRVNGLKQCVLVLLGFEILVSGASSQQAVRILTSFSRIVVYRNERAILDCPFNMSRSVTKEWTKDGQPLELSRRIQHHDNGSLVIERARNRRRDEKNDSGLYECYVKTDFGTLLARHVELKVIRQTLSISAEDLEVSVGGTARFECSTNDEDINQPSYLWEHPQGNNYVFDDPRIYIFHGVIQIHNVTEADEGDYICKILPRISGNMKMLEKSAFLKIISGPTVTAPLIPTVVNTPLAVSTVVGQPALLECLVDGLPALSITWTFPETSLVPPGGDARVNVSSHSNIRFTSTVAKDAGTYFCNIRHTGNQIILRKYTLDIITPPGLEDPPVPVIQYPFVQRSRISCSPTGNPKPSISWYKNGYKVFPEFGEELILFGRLDDNGYYQCLVSNSLGNILATTWVHYMQSPDTPDKVNNIEATPLSSSQVQLTWNASADVDNYVAYSIDFYPVYEDPCPGHCVYLYYIERDVTKVPLKTIEGLKPYTLYTFNVQAVSLSGGGTLSDPVTVRTLEAVPTDTPKVQISPDSVSSFRVSWSQIPEGARNGIINRHQLAYGTKLKQTHILVSGETFNYLVTGLIPDTEYMVQVLSGNSVGFPRNAENWVTYRTPKASEQDGPLPQLVFQPLNASSVLLTWNGEDFQNVGKYRITVQYLLDSGPVKEYNVSASQNSFVITGLGTGSCSCTP